jgi:hypothetical protein
MKITIHRGKIEEFHSWGSGIATLIISSKPVHCEKAPTVRALDSCFGNVITADHCVNNRAIRGKDIVYWMDEFGLILGGFVPTKEWREKGYAAPKIGYSRDVSLGEDGSRGDPDSNVDSVDSSVL